MRSLSKVLKDWEIFVEHNPGRKEQKDPAPRFPAQEFLQEAQEEKERILSLAKDEANQIIRQAEAFSQSLLSQAKETIKADRENARKEGYDAGFSRGTEQGENKVKTHLSELCGLLETVESKKEEVLYRHEKDLKDLALLIAKKIIDTELSAGDRAFLSLFKNTVRGFEGQEWVKITVSQQEKNILTSQSELLKSALRGAKEIEITAKPDAPLGTLIIETPHSLVDAGVDTQLGKIKTMFLDVMTG
jgi:flagellar assembly protein FliH